MLPVSAVSMRSVRAVLVKRQCAMKAIGTTLCAASVICSALLHLVPLFAGIVVRVMCFTRPMARAVSTHRPVRAPLRRNL